MPVSDYVKLLVPALLALTGVWLGSMLTRGREDRAWRRAQLVAACSDFIKAASAVEQWAASDQFASMLGDGQYPPDYKKDLEGLATAEAVLSVSAADMLRAGAEEASSRLRTYVTANAVHQARRPKGSPRDPDAYAALKAEWNSGSVEVLTARDSWSRSRNEFVRAVRNELDGLR